MNPRPKHHPYWLNHWQQKSASRQRPIFTVLLAKFSALILAGILAETNDSAPLLRGKPEFFAAEHVSSSPSACDGPTDCGKQWAGELECVSAYAITFFSVKPTNASRPALRSRSEEGSGTVWPEIENAALNGP